MNVKDSDVISIAPVPGGEIEALFQGFKLAATVLGTPYGSTCWPDPSGASNLRYTGLAGGMGSFRTLQRIALLIVPAFRPPRNEL